METRKKIIVAKTPEVLDMKLTAILENFDYQLDDIKVSSKGNIAELFFQVPTNMTAQVA